MRPVVLFFVSLVVFASAVRASELVPAKLGYPALTQEMLERSSAFVEWAMGVQFTPAQRSTQQAFVLDHWKKGDAEDIGSLLELLDLEKQVSAMSAAEKAQLPEKVRPAVLESLRQESAEGDAEAKWLLDVYESYIDRPIVGGDGKNVPPLTPSMLRRYADMMELAWDLRLTDAQRKTLDEQVIGHWRRRDVKDVESILSWLETEREASSAPEAQRIVVSRLNIYPEIMKQAPIEAKTDPDVRWLLGVHDEFHKPLVDGKAPLTRRQSESFLEVLFFAASVIEGVDPVRPTAQMLDEWNAQLASGWNNLPQAGRAGVAQMADVYAKLVAGWAQLGADEQAQIKQTFGQIPQVQTIAQTIRAQRADEEQRKQQIARDRADGKARASARAKGMQDAGATAVASSASPSSSSAGPSAEFLKAQQQLYWERQKTQMISNMMQQMHETRMMVIYNTGGNGYTWEYRPKY
jgi:hypothetical protein